MDSEIPWRVRTFGGFSVERAGVRHDRFRTQHGAALLAYLSLRPDVRHSREVLAELLWPEADALVARQRLSSALANLRKELESSGQPVFSGGRDSVGVHPGTLTSDAAEFNLLVRQSRGASRERRRERLREALELAGKGDFLPGFYFEWVIEQSSRFEETLDAVRAELEAETEGPTLWAEDASSLIGRSLEIEALDRLLMDRHRCVSILGTGGVGKTRLALEIFERHSRRFPGAKAFVRLAEVRRPSDFLVAVAQALNLSWGEADAPMDAISGALTVPGLLVLDNLEHLLPDIHSTLDHLLRACGNSTFVCTSRRRMDIAGEQVIRVRPLRSAPFHANPEDLANAPSNRLFLSRYQEAGGFPLPSENLPAVDEICRALGGLPLGIQLAASASVAVGLEALRESAMLYRLLPGRNPDATNPHASLGEMIEWSLTLISPATRQVLEALCLLPGSFNLALVRKLYDEEAGLALPRLHSDSLLEADGQGTMRVLEPIRDHVIARMDKVWRASQEIHLIRRCADLSRDLGPRLRGPDQRSAMEDVTALWPTMRRAVQLAIEHKMPNEGLAIIGELDRYFLINYSGSDALALAEPLINLPGIDVRVHARTLANLSRHAFTAGRFDASLGFCVEGAALASQIGDRGAEAKCRYCQAHLAMVREDKEETLALARRAFELGYEAGDIESQVFANIMRGLAYCLYQRGASVNEVRKSQRRAEDYMKSAVLIAREAKDDLMEAIAEYFQSVYSAIELDVYCACLTRSVDIYRKNGWKLREAHTRAALVRRLYAAGQVGNVLEELSSLKKVFAECGRWEVRAEQVSIEAEILFRMNRYEEALVTVEEAIECIEVHGRATVVEEHLLALIYFALGRDEVDRPLLALVDQGDKDEFSAMIAEMARALLDVRRGDFRQGFRRLQAFKPETKPTRVQHAFADTLVVFADEVMGRNRDLAVAAYRQSRFIYRKIESAIDLRRVRMRVSETSRKPGSGVRVRASKND